MIILSIINNYDTADGNENTNEDYYYYELL